MGRAIAIALALGAAVGCGDDAPAIPLAELHTASVRAECDYLVRCGLFAEHDTCTAYFRIPDERVLAAAVEAGKLRYDGAAAKRCQDALAIASCDLTSRDARLHPDCDAMFRGAVRAGAPCGLDLECESGDCDLPTCPSSTCCPGTCLAIERRALDEPCDSDANCVAETFCGADQRCRALAQLAEPCRADSHCAYGLACIGASDLQPGACRAMNPIGGPCPYLRCAEAGARCDEATHLCVPLGLPGAPCTTDAECSPYAQCGPSQQCIDRPRLGMPCTIGCAGEAWCDARVCSPPLDNTTPCSADDQCASLFCEEGPIFDQCATRPVCI